MTKRINSRRKGKVGELEAAKLLQRLFGIDFRRGRQYKGTEDSPDLVSSLHGIWWEVKRRQRINLHEVLREAKQQCGDNVPVVLHRRDRERWLITVDAEDMPTVVVLLYLAMASNGACEDDD